MEEKILQRDNSLQRFRKYIDYKNILRIINVIAASRDIEFEVKYDPEDRSKVLEDEALHFTYLGKKYTIQKFKDMVKIDCSDGRTMWINYNTFYERDVDGEIVSFGRIGFTIHINERSYLQIRDLEPDWLETDYDIKRLRERDLKNSTLLYASLYGSSSLDSSSMTLGFDYMDKDCAGNIGDDVLDEEVKDGELSVHGYVISNDYKKVISYRGRKILSPEHINDLETEFAYRRLPALKEACEFRDRLISGDAKKVLFTEDELDLVYLSLYYALTDKLEKFDKEFLEYIDEKNLEMKKRRKEEYIEDAIKRTTHITPDELDDIISTLESARMKK